MESMLVAVFDSEDTALEAMSHANAIGLHAGAIVTKTVDGAITVIKAHRPASEFFEMHGRGHALTIDHGWRDVADTALAFIGRFVH